MADKKKATTYVLPQEVRVRAIVATGDWEEDEVRVMAVDKAEKLEEKGKHVVLREYQTA